jgi:hypothetical protein
VGRAVSTRLSRRNHFTPGQAANGNCIPGLPAWPTKLLLRGTRDGRSAHGAGFRGHEPIVLQVRALCHTTFAGVTAFDKHRVNGHCVPPTRLGMSLLPGRPYPCWGYPAEETT